MSGSPEGVSGRPSASAVRQERRAGTTGDHSPGESGCPPPREITDPEDFQALRQDWNALVENGGRTSVFLRHEWFDAAWQWQPPGARPLVLAWYREGRLVGAAALVQYRERRIGVPIRSLGFLTVPDTQECDLVCAEAHCRLVHAAFARWLRRNRHRWDALHLRALPAAQGSRDPLAGHMAQEGLASVATPDDANFRIPLTGSWEDFYRSRSRKLKKNNNLVANRLAAAGEVEVEWHRAADADPQALEHAVAVSAESWKSSLGVSLGYPGPNAFIRRLSDHARRQGWLSIWLLTLDGRPVAMEYQLIYAGRVHALRGDFVSQHDALSPGTHLNHRIIRALFEEEGLATYLMGPGDNPYKRRWTDDADVLQGLVAYSRTWRGSGVRLWDRHLRPAARKARDGVGRILSRIKGGRT